MAATVTLTTPEADSVFKPALLLMSGRMLAFVATFFIPVVLVRLFDPAEFGTYKQLFLIFSTIFSIAQLGMATSLYYFLPSSPSEAGGYVANSMLFLGTAGLACFGLVVLAAPRLAKWMSNREMASYLPWIGLYLFLMLLSAALEIVSISRGRYLWASASYAISDLARAAAFILPALVFRQLRWLLWSAVAVAFARVVVSLFYFRREFRGTFSPNPALLKSQLTYALPFAAAVLIETLQSSLPQYAVSYMFDPATFAIFAVGCLQIPLVDFAASPTSDVMMVKMQERLADGRMHALLKIWHDATWKLALLFFPLVAFCIVAAREIIVFLFTSKYLASAPIFMTWSTVILLTILQVDGVMRVFAQTWFLLALNIMRLAIIAGLIQWSLSTFRLLGPVLVILLATLAFKIAAMVRMKVLLGISTAELLPWRSLAALVGAAAGSAAAATAVKSQVHASTVPLLFTTAAVCFFTYTALVWRLDLLNADEKLALTGWVQKATGMIARTLDFGRV